MPAAEIKTKDDLIIEIKEKISDISCNEPGRPVNLNNVLFCESGRSNGGVKINITCLFINEDGKVCADMYRSGTAGCVDFICGLDLNSVNEKILKQIVSAFDENRWSVTDSTVIQKQKKKHLVSTFKIPFIQKGA